MATAAKDTSNWKLNHTMFRVKDAKKSIDWYEKVLGMEVVHESPGGDFTNYFLAFPGGFKGTPDAAGKKSQLFQREGILELCHNWGTESDPNFKGYVNGNEEPHRGFGHIAVVVDNLEEAVKRFDELGVKFKKRPEDGRMRHIAFILDPDNYWVEILASSRD